MYEFSTSGRLILLRLKEPLSVTDIQKLREQIQATMQRFPPAQKGIICVDMRGIASMKADVRDEVVKTMQSDNERMERGAIIVSNASTLPLQMHNAAVSAGRERRMISTDPIKIAEWLIDLLSPLEETHLRRYIDASRGA